MPDQQTPTAQAQAARSPWHMPWSDWKAVLLRAWKEAGDDNASLVAAGVGFYAFLALVPLMAAMVLSYGLLADPATVVKDMRGIAGSLPTDAASLINDQLANVVRTSSGAKGFGVVTALALALFGARNGASAIVTALNIAYDEEETRGFIRLNLLALAITAMAAVVAIAAAMAIAALGALEKLVPGLPGVMLVLGKLLSYVLLALLGAAGAATLYRFGPDRRQAQWVWLTPGSLGAALLWLALTAGFGFYVSNFGNYNATYGALGAVVVLLTWLYLSAYVLLLGAEVNAELEHQTAQDTTVGADRPAGERGATAADQTGADAPARTTPQPATSPPPAASRTGSSRAIALALPTSGVVHAVGLGRGAAIPAALAGAGAARLRHRDGALTGVALLAAAGLIAWLGRDRDEPEPDQRKAARSGA